MPDVQQERGSAAGQVALRVGILFVAAVTSKPLPSCNERRKRFEVAGAELDGERWRCERFERYFVALMSKFRARVLEWR